jgi:lipopolysaccharide biosynthesis glycosyltransferase
VVDFPLKIVSIMNYPREPKYLRMCYIFLDSVIAHGAKSITVLYEELKPVIAPEHRRAADIELVKGKSHDLGHPHFNLRFKLPNLANLKFPYLFLDADMVVLSDLHYLWTRRKSKPWIGIDHQVIPFDVRTQRSPFLNSGLQLVSDPAFYDLGAILAVQNAVVPLSKHKQIKVEDAFHCPGHDQAVLFRYFRTIGYDYTHPEIGPEWNSCAGVSEVRVEDGAWKARTRALARNHEVHIVHYWDQFKPWAIDCPIFRSYAWVDDALRRIEGSDFPPHPERKRRG